MTAPLSIPTTLRQEIEEVGFCVLPELFSEQELATMRRLLDAQHQQAGSPSLAGWGHAIHPLRERAPAMAPFFHHPALIAAFETILDGPVRLAHSGARLASELSQASIGWHEHYAWDRAAVTTRSRPQRLLMNLYVDGSDDETGPLIVLPRALRDPLDAPCTDAMGEWPGQREVRVAPGSAVLFDTALWHTARRGTRSGRRRLWGGHLMPLADLRPHREDNDALAVQHRRLLPVPLPAPAPER